MYNDVESNDAILICAIALHYSRVLHPADRDMFFPCRRPRSGSAVPDDTRFMRRKALLFLAVNRRVHCFFAYLGFFTANVGCDLYKKRLTRKERLGITLGLAWIWSAETNTGLQKGIPDKSINTAIGGKPHLCRTLVYQENEVI